MIHCIIFVKLKYSKREILHLAVPLQDQRDKKTEWFIFFVGQVTAYA